MSKKDAGGRRTWPNRPILVLVIFGLLPAACALAAPDAAAPKTSSISGKVSLSGNAKGGFVLALTTKERRASGGSEIAADGTYTIPKLAAGMYDLAFVALGYERKIGLGYLPSPNTLKPEEQQAIRNLYAKLDAAVVKKDTKAVMSVYSKSYKASPPAMTAQEVREFWSTVFSASTSVKIVRNIHIITGKTGESAVVVSHSELTMNLKPNPRLKGQKTMEREQDNATRLALENGAWKIVGNAPPPDACVDCDVYGGAIVSTLPGEPAKVEWRYTNDPAITAITLTAGMESKGHDVSLTLLK